MSMPQTERRYLYGQEARGVQGGAEARARIPIPPNPKRTKQRRRTRERGRTRESPASLLPLAPSLLKTVEAERTWFVNDRPERKETRTYEQLPNDRQVRLTIISTITHHLRDPADGGAPPSWQ